MEEVINSLKNLISNPNWSDIATVSLALWGSILATINFIQDRPRIKVGLTRGFTVPNMEDIIELAIHNYGRRPITVTSAGFVSNRRKDGILFPWPEQYIKYGLPQVLKENEEVSLALPLEVLRSSAEENKVSINFVYFKDALGNSYRRKVSSRLWKDLQYSEDRNILSKAWRILRFYR